MNRLLFCFLLIISDLVGAQQTKTKPNHETEKFYTEILKIIKKHSLYSDSLDWNKLPIEIQSLPFSENDSINRSLVMLFFRNKLLKAGDRHSFFLTKRLSSYINTQLPEVHPEGQYLENGIGLIKVPRSPTLDMTKDKEFANEIRREIKKIDTTNNITGWIVDLRHNTGGNMWPMLAGLNALIADGTVGYFVSFTPKSVSPWVSKNGRLRMPKGKIDSYKIKGTKVKIAVLIDSMTASSGEMTAISFIGLPNVKVFGQQSAGLTTANTFYGLSDGIQLALTVSCVADRTKKLYLSGIIPDIIVNISSSAVSDQTLKTAKDWLMQISQK